MTNRQEPQLTAGFIYEISGLSVLVLPVANREGGWTFHKVLLDVEGNTLRGGRSPYQPDEAGRICRDGKPTGKVLDDLEFASEGRAPPWQVPPPFFD